MSNENVHEEFETVVLGKGTESKSGSGVSMPEEVLSVGDILCDTYILRARLGRGGMGEVWKADEVYEGEILSSRASCALHGSSMRSQPWCLL